MFNLRFDIGEVRDIAVRYPEKSYDQDMIGLGREIFHKHEFSRDDLLKICDWKSPRIRRFVQRNRENDVIEISKCCMGTNSERVRIESLITLDGVGWPVASAILHFVFENEYPVLDYRALWSLSVLEPPGYNYSFWSDYVECCRGLAKKGGVTMRELDQALWQYSVEHQH